MLLVVTRDKGLLRDIDVVKDSPLKKERSPNLSLHKMDKRKTPAAPGFHVVLLLLYSYANMNRRSAAKVKVKKVLNS